jgi:hypothetical protein
MTFFWVKEKVFEEENGWRGIKVEALMFKHQFWSFHNCIPGLNFLKKIFSSN